MVIHGKSSHKYEYSGYIDTAITKLGLPAKIHSFKSDFDVSKYVCLVAWNCANMEIHLKTKVASFLFNLMILRGA